MTVFEIPILSPPISEDVRINLEETGFFPQTMQKAIKVINWLASKRLSVDKQFYYIAQMKRS